MRGDKYITFSLARKMWKSYKGLNLILISSIAVVGVIVYLLISLAMGRGQAEHLKIIRENGIDANGVLTQSTQEQLHKAQEFKYISEVGIENIIGMWSNETDKIATVKIMEDTAFDIFYRKTLKQMTGVYPKEINEILISVESLKMIGIDEPVLGMEIPIDIYTARYGKQKRDVISETFILAGYYEEYEKEITRIPTAYLCNSYFTEEEKQETENQMLIQSDEIWLGNMHFEEQIMQDLESSVEQSLIIKHVGVVSYIGNIGKSLLNVVVWNINKLGRRLLKSNLLPSLL